MISHTFKDGGVTFSVRVQPRASRSEVVGEMDGALKIRLAAPPVDGEANSELVRMLSKIFSVPRSRIAILSGETSKTKLIRIEGISVEAFGGIIGGMI